MGQPSFGDELRRLREQQGLSLKKLARLVHYDSGYLSKVENGIKPPTATLAAECDAALQGGGWLMQLATKGRTESAQQNRLFSNPAKTQDSNQRPPTPSSYNHSIPVATKENESARSTLNDRDKTDINLDVTLESLEEFMADQSEGGDDILRREILESSVAARLSIILPEYYGRRIGPHLIEKLRTRGARLRRLDNFLGGAETYSLYKEELNSTIKIFQTSRYTEGLRCALLDVIAEQAQQAGWAAFDAGQEVIARKLFRLSYSAAQNAKNFPLAGNSLAFIAYQEVSAGRSGITMAKASCHVAGSNAPGVVRALLLERKAWAYAKENLPTEAEFALAEASNALDREDAEPQPDWASWVDHREIKIMTGRCWAELQRPLRAVEPLETALVDFDDTHGRDKSLYLSWLADAYLDGGEVEQCAATVSRALDLSAGVGSVRPRQRLTAVVKRLEHHRNLGAVDSILHRAAQELKQ